MPLNFHDPLDALAWQITGKTTVLNWARGRNKQLYPSISTVAINTIGKTSGRIALTSLPPQQTKLETGSAGQRTWVESGRASWKRKMLDRNVIFLL